MLTMQYNEPMFILMLRGRVGCLWLQSIKNLSCVKLCVCVIVYTSQCNMKPKCIIDYNTYMHGVDTADQ